MGITLHEADFLFKPSGEVYQRVQRCAPLLSPPFGKLMGRNGSTIRFPVNLSELSSVLYAKNPKTGSTTLTGILQRLSLMYPDIALHVMGEFGGKAAIESGQVKPWCKEYASLLSGSKSRFKAPYDQSLDYFFATKAAIMDAAEANSHLVVDRSLRRPFDPHNSSKHQLPCVRVYLGCC